MDNIKSNLVNIQNDSSKTNILLAILEQNWLHLRHVESERILCLNAYVIILAAIFYALTNTNLNYVPYLISFLLMFSVINFLLSLKFEAVIEDYIKKNEAIVNKLGMKEFAGLRVKSGFWGFIRLRYIFPFFYCIISIALLMALIIHIIVKLIVYFNIQQNVF